METEISTVIMFRHTFSFTSVVFPSDFNENLKKKLITHDLRRSDGTNV